MESNNILTDNVHVSRPIFAEMLGLLLKALVGVGIKVVVHMDGLDIIASNEVGYHLAEEVARLL